LSQLLTRKGSSLRNAAFVCLTIALWTACNRNETAVPPDHPRLTPNVVMRDVTFHSAALSRDAQYRVILPARIVAGTKLPVVYLLHGGGGNFRDWSHYSDVARFAERGLILAMPEGDESYYTNSADRPQDRYEDYIATDLVADVEPRFPAATGRANRSIVGLSMGGFGAVKITLRHPDVYVFAGELSSAIDVPGRPFSIKRVHQWRHYWSIFGPWGSPTRRENDPFALTRSADPAKTPYFFLTCGEQEGLLPSHRTFAAWLAQRHFAFEFHTVRGGHDWNQWNGWLDDCFQSLLGHLGPKSD
jgi:putative tributyrin esterase